MMGSGWKWTSLTQEDEQGVPIHPKEEDGQVGGFGSTFAETRIRSANGGLMTADRGFGRGGGSVPP